MSTLNERFTRGVALEGLIKQMSLSGVLLLTVATSVRAASCESLSSISLPNTKITLAQSVAPGKFVLPDHPWPKNPGFENFDYASLPTFCRVAAEARPTSDSHIKFEVWMPSSNWNGKFQGTGNGVWSGEIWYPPLAQALVRGYATANTDTGHEGAVDDGSFALNHPEKVIDFGYRAVHEMTVQAKAIVTAFYGRAPRFSYWNGCSSGGKQGLKEAQQFPMDYDGIVAGAPGNYWTHLVASLIPIGDATRPDSVHYIPPSKHQLLHKAVLAACDSADGIKDGILNDPRRCVFDPNQLLCKGKGDSDCLTASEAEAAAAIYRGLKTRTGRQLYPGLAPGSELGWAFIANMRIPGVEHFRYLTFRNPSWDYRTFNAERDVARADELDHNIINATDPNLTRFFGHGGKVLLYHGWNDPALAPQNTIDYYNSVRLFVGNEAANNSMRLYMAPGMGHCGGGEGPNQFDKLAALETWVEDGKAPERIIASHRQGSMTDRTRPLCPFPQLATYTGSGSTDDAANFVCSAAK